jgi:hypothetical protein
VIRKSHSDGTTVQITFISSFLAHRFGDLLASTMALTQ